MTGEKIRILRAVFPKRWPAFGFAAGNFLYIGASDLVPEVNKHRDMKVNLVHLGAFVASVALMWTIRVVLSH